MQRESYRAFLQPFFCSRFSVAGLSCCPLFQLSPAGLHKAFKYIGGHSICLPHILRMPLKGQKIGIIRHLQGLDDAVGRMAAGNEAGGNPAYGLMMNSRLMMMMTTQAGSCPSSIRQISAEQTRSLSASGSINLPKLVTRLYFLAILPSNRSVRLATMNRTFATIRMV